MLRDGVTISVCLCGLAASAARAPAEVVVQTIDHGVVVGDVVSFSIDGGLEIVSIEGRARFSTEDIVSITRTARAAASSEALLVVTLAGKGRRDRLVGTPGAFEDDRVILNVPSLGPTPVPLEHMAVWRNPSFDQPVHEAAVELMFALPEDGNDHLLVANGDRLSGLVVVADSEGFVLDTPDGELRIAHDQVVAASIVGVPVDRKPGPRLPVSFTDGSRVTASALDWSARGVTLTLFGGIQRRVAEDAIARVDVVGGRWQWLSELEPVAVDQTPMMSVAWPVRVDRNVLGGPLVVGGASFERGFGVHARSALAFDVSGGYREFVTRYGLDDDSGPLGDVAIGVVVDGVVRFERADLRRGMLGGPLRVDVTGARRLELVVDFGRLGGVQDRFDWIEPALIR